MKHNFEEIMKNKLSLDDEFEFGCNRCGECCHQETLILTGYDVFNIAKYLNITTEGVLKEYCFGYIGDDSKIPIISLKQRTGDNSCPFLRKSICTINSVKPLTCKIYPIGRFYDSRTKEFVYFKQNVGCGTKEKHTVKEWVGSVGIKEVDNIGIKWGNSLLDLAKYQRSIKDKNRLDASTKLILIALYINYDTSKGYLEELEKNLKILENLLPKFKRKHS